MKKFWNTYKPVISFLLLWRITLWVIESISPSLIPLRLGFNGPIPWSNFDGILYLKIVEEGYYKFSQAFFPLYPIIIYSANIILPFPPWITGEVLSLVFFVLAVFIFYTNIYKENKSKAVWTVLFLIAFPTSFFFSAVYTEGLFLFLSVLVFIFANKKKWFWCGVFGALASTTKLFGVLLFLYVFMEYISSKPKKIILFDILSISLIPLGLISYMIYLYIKNGDPLLFVHLQPLFGANRSGTMIILLPQVFWRYGKIIFTAFFQPTPTSYFISVLELIATLFGYGVLYVGWKTKTKLSYLVYGLLTITMPTLTGTFSSMPRYLLSVFPLFLILGKLDNKTVKFILLSIFIVLQIILSAMFLRGWFVA